MKLIEIKTGGNSFQMVALFRESADGSTSQEQLEEIREIIEEHGAKILKKKVDEDSIALLIQVPKNKIDDLYDELDKRSDSIGVYTNEHGDIPANAMTSLNESSVPTDDSWYVLDVRKKKILAGELTREVANKKAKELGGSVWFTDDGAFYSPDRSVVYPGLGWIQESTAKYKQWKHGDVVTDRENNLHIVDRQDGVKVFMKGKSHGHIHPNNLIAAGHLDAVHAAKALGTLDELPPVYGKVEDFIHRPAKGQHLKLMSDGDLKSLIAKTTGQNKFALRVALKVLGRREPD